MIYYITHKEPNWKAKDVTLLDSTNKVIEMFRNTDIIAADTENNSLNPILATPLLSQFSDGIHSYVLDNTTVDISFLKEFQKKQYLMQNGQYDYCILKWHYGIELRNIIDIMMIEQILGRGSGRSSSLENIHLRRLGIPMPIPKSTRNDFLKMKYNPIFQYEHIKYSAYDPLCYFPIYETQKPFIEQYHLNKRIYEIAMPVSPILGDMLLNGFTLNKVKWNEILQNNKSLKFTIECKLDNEISRFSKDYIELRGGKWTNNRRKEEGEQVGLFNDSITIGNSNTHNVSYSSLNDLVKFFKIIKEPIPQKKDKKGEYRDSFAEEALEQYKINNPSSRVTTFINYLLEYRELEKAINSFGEIFLRDRIKASKTKNSKKFKRGYMNPITNKIHTIYKQEFTKNGRLSSGEGGKSKAEDKLGLYNSQQTKKENKYRNCFTLTQQEIDDDTWITTFDLDGAELRILASHSQDQALIKILTSGEDIHSYLATKSYNKIFRYILNTMSPNRAYDELANLLMPNRLQNDLEKEIGKNEFIPYTKEELLLIQKDRVRNVIEKGGIVIDKKKYIDIRNPTKNAHYGINYGATESKIAETLNIAPYYSELYMQGLEEAIPNAMRYLKRVAKDAVRNGYIIFNNRTNSRHWFKSWLDAKTFGRELSFKERSDIERAAKNYGISGTQADMIKECMVAIQSYIDINNIIDFKWLLQVHDELVFKHKRKEFGEKEIAPIITKTCNLYLKDIEMKVSGYTGHYWNH